MSSEESAPGLDSTTGEEGGGAPPGGAPESATPAPLPKKGPPVAPKPTWFRHSKKRAEDEQRQKAAPGRTAELGPPVSSSRGLAPVSCRANLSLRQKIHSFETFSSPSSLERDPRRPLVASCPAPLVMRGSRRPQGWQDCKEPPKEETNGAALPKRAEDPTSEAKISAGTTVTGEAPITASEPDRSPVSSSTGLHPEVAGTAPLSDSGCDRGNTSLSEQKVGLRETSRSSSTVSPPAPAAPRHPGEGSSSEWKEGPAKPDGTTAVPTDIHPSQRDLDGESKILGFSHKVSLMLTAALLKSPSHGPPCLHTTQDPPAAGSLGLREQSPAAISAERGSSVSLAELREHWMKPERLDSEAGTPDPRALIPAVCSTVPPQEVEELMKGVVELDTELLKKLEQLYAVILQKEEGVGLGFSIAGGSDLENKAPTVHKVFASGLAAAEGTIQKGDKILSINGQTLRDMKHTDATAALRQARTAAVAVVVIHKEAESGERRSEELRAEAVREQGALVTVQLDKGSGGVGFTVEGGKGSVHGDKPVVIKKILTGGAAEPVGLQRGDVLLRVQGISLQDKTRSEAWNLIKTQPDGVLELLIRRRQQGAPSDAAAEEGPQMRADGE